MHLDDQIAGAAKFPRRSLWELTHWVRNLSMTFPARWEAGTFPAVAESQTAMACHGNLIACLSRSPRGRTSPANDCWLGLRLIAIFVTLTQHRLLTSFLATAIKAACLLLPQASMSVNAGRGTAVGMAEDQPLTLFGCRQHNLRQTVGRYLTGGWPVLVLKFHGAPAAPMGRCCQPVLQGWGNVSCETFIAKISGTT
jgi:hypothetical protein